MNQNAEAWIVEEWEKANQIDTAEHWVELMLKIGAARKCCSAKNTEEHWELSVLECISFERAGMAFC